MKQHDSVARLVEQLAKIEQPRFMDFLEELQQKFIKTEVGTLEELSPRFEELQDEAKKQFKPIQDEYFAKLRKCAENFGIKEKFFQASAFANLPNGRAVFEPVWEAACKQKRTEEEWFMVYRTFPWFEECALGVMKALEENQKEGS